MPLPGDARLDRLTDHRDLVLTPQQHDLRQQHMRAQAAPTPRPPGSAAPRRERRLRSSRAIRGAGATPDGEGGGDWEGHQPRPEPLGRRWGRACAQPSAHHVQARRPTEVWITTTHALGDALSPELEAIAAGLLMTGSRRRLDRIYPLKRPRSDVWPRPRAPRSPQARH